MGLLYLLMPISIILRQNTLGGYHLKSTTIIEIEGKTLVISAELYECFKHFYINNIRKIYNGIMSKDNIQFYI